MLYPTVFRDLTLFVEVAQRKSFSKAAAALGIPISSVSRRIRALEETLGVQLLERTTRRLKLTREGEIWLPQIARSIADAERMLAQIQRQDRAPSEVLTVAVPDELWAVERLAKAIPGGEQAREFRLHCELQTGQGGERPRDLDLAVSSGSQPPPDGMTQSIGSVETALFASPAYVAAQGAPEHPDDLSTSRIILAKQQPSEIWTLTREGESISVAVRGAITSSSAVLALKLALAGNGIVAADLVAAVPEVQAGRLIRLLPEWSLPRRPISLTSGLRPLSPEARNVVASIARSFTGEQAPASG